ncbi:hypothetical protein NSTCB13_06352 [Nostoc sp. DSM 114160]|jgi:hypothetical protein
MCERSVTHRPLSFWCVTAHLVRDNNTEPVQANERTDPTASHSGSDQPIESDGGGLAASSQCARPQNTSKPIR